MVMTAFFLFLIKLFLNLTFFAFVENFHQIFLIWFLIEKNFFKKIQESQKKNLKLKIRSAKPLKKNKKKEKQIFFWNEKWIEFDVFPRWFFLFFFLQHFNFSIFPFSTFLLSKFKSKLFISNTIIKNTKTRF